jgi:hypothetical protein
MNCPRDNLSEDITGGGQNAWRSHINWHDGNLDFGTGFPVWCGKGREKREFALFSFALGAFLFLRSNTGRSRALFLHRVRQHETSLGSHFCLFVYLLNIHQLFLSSACCINTEWASLNIVFMAEWDNCEYIDWITWGERMPVLSQSEKFWWLFCVNYRLYESRERRCVDWVNAR